VQAGGRVANLSSSTRRGVVYDRRLFQLNKARLGSRRPYARRWSNPTTPRLTGPRSAGNR